MYPNSKRTDVTPIFISAVSLSSVDKRFCFVLLRTLFCIKCTHTYNIYIYIVTA